MPYSFFDAEVFRIIDESDVVKRFFFRVNSPEPFSFKAGQFVMLDLPIESKVKTRSYSIASAPTGNKEFELVIVLKPGGLGTEFLWANVSEGSVVKVSKPIGKFALPELIDRDICFIATGTGIAPLRSMLLDVLARKQPHKNLYMVFGNRYEKDILYRKEMEDLQKELEHFEFIPVLSREDEWKGRKGYVHCAYQELFSNRQPAYFYICGWHDMLHECRERLENMGYEKQYIKFESYD